MLHARVAAALLAAMLFGMCYMARATDDAPVTQELNVAGAKIRLDFVDSDFGNGTAQLATWVERSATIVRGYYDGFPAGQLRIRIHSTDGGGVRNGTTYGQPAPHMDLYVGREVTAAELMQDWILVHEMVHLALPEVGRRHSWLAEGLATYVEGIARVQAGNQSAKDVWAENMRAMPQGLPKSGDEGLDNTHTWGRTYWGGALFCLQADVEIRQKTRNRFGLQDALRAIAKSSRGIAFEWPIDRVFATGDAAVGTSVLSDLYARMKGAPEAPDLEALWKDLGIRRSGMSVELRNDAPLAPIRDAIMRAAQRQ